MNIFFPKKIIGVLAIFVFLVIFLGMPATAGADDSSSLKGLIKLEVGIGNERTAKGISYYIGMVYNFAAAIVGVVAVVMIIIGGIQYSASAGNPAALASAKETITSAIIGLAIVLMSYLILGAFSGKFTNLAEPNIKQINIDESDSGDDQQSGSGVCLSGEIAYNDVNTCNTNCRKEYNQDCTTRYGQNANEAVYCCLQQKAPDNCTNVCEPENYVCKRERVPCHEVTDDFTLCMVLCRDYPEKRMDCLVDDPRSDYSKCLELYHRMGERCKTANQGEPCGYPVLTNINGQRMVCCQSGETL